MYSPTLIYIAFGLEIIFFKRTDKGMPGVIVTLGQSPHKIGHAIGEYLQINEMWDRD